jgi:DNA-binding CsgD family transcriptional regulator
MNASSAPSQRTHPAIIGARASSCGPALFRAGKKFTGSPGSAVFADQTWIEIAGRLGLSDREGEIVRRVFDDQTEFAIAADLGISPHTVHTHFERLHKKLGVADRVQLVLCITQECLRQEAPPQGMQPSLNSRRATAQV